MADYFISSKANGTGADLSDLSSLHIGTSDTAADTLSIRVTTTATNMNRLRVITFLENAIRVLIQGGTHSTKLPIA